MTKSLQLSPIRRLPREDLGVSFWNPVSIHEDISSLTKVTALRVQAKIQCLLRGGFQGQPLQACGKVDILPWKRHLLPAQTGLCGSKPWRGASVEPSLRRKGGIKAHLGVNGYGQMSTSDSIPLGLVSEGCWSQVVWRPTEIPNVAVIFGAMTMSEI